MEISVKPGLDLIDYCGNVYVRQNKSAEVLQGIQKILEYRDKRVIKYDNN